MPSTVVYIALGTNEGERWENLRMAIASLTRCVLADRCSDVYETEPAYVLDQPRYLNMVIAGTTELEPYALLHCLKNLEQHLGRTVGRRWGERRIDLDILIYGDLRMAQSDLTIPHERMHERSFVLQPLMDLAPDLVPPGMSRTVRELVAAAPPHGMVLARLGPLTTNQPSTE